MIEKNAIQDHEDDFGDCTKCIHSQQTEPHVWECDAKEYDIDTKSCWRPIKEKIYQSGDYKNV